VAAVGVSNLALAAGWLVISQLLWLIGNRSAADAALIKGAVESGVGGVSRGAVVRSAGKYSMLSNIPVLALNLWCFGGKPTGDGHGVITPFIYMTLLRACSRLGSWAILNWPLKLCSKKASSCGKATHVFVHYDPLQHT